MTNPPKKVFHSLIQALALPILQKLPIQVWAVEPKRLNILKWLIKSV